MKDTQTMRYHRVALPIQTSKAHTIPDLSSSVSWALCLLNKYITYISTGNPTNEMPKRIYPKFNASAEFNYSYYYFFSNPIALLFNLLVILVPTYNYPVYSFTVTSESFPTI